MALSGSALLVAIFADFNCLQYCTDKLRPHLNFLCFYHPAGLRISLKFPKSPPKSSTELALSPYPQGLGPQALGHHSSLAVWWSGTPRPARVDVYDHTSYMVTDMDYYGRLHAGGQGQGGRGQGMHR